LTATSVTRGTGAASSGLTLSNAWPINFSGLKQMTINAGLGNDTLGVTGLPANPVTFNGGGGSNTVIGAATINNWLITGANYGTLDTSLTFQAQNLLGGAAGNTFAFHTGGVLSGSLTGGGSSSNTLTYSAYSGNVVVNLKLGTATAVAGAVSSLQSVTGGMGTSILVGDGNESSLIGGAGRSLLIAGPLCQAPVALLGGNSEDILVGGSTKYDTDPTALNALMAEWTRTNLGSAKDPTGYLARVNHLLQGGGLNGTTLLGSTNFHGNGGGNTLMGGAGLDLFYGSKALDHIDWNDAQGEIFIEGQAHQNTQINATALTLPNLYLDNMLMSATTVSSLALTPGPHTLSAAAGSGASLIFEVAADGTVDYAPSLEGMLTGRGTSTLTVRKITQ
jgi:hypothetical protein